MKIISIGLFKVFLLLQLQTNAYGQGVAINTTGTDADPSSMLDVNNTTKGVLISRMSTAQRDAIASPAQGLLIYNTTTKCFEFYDNSSWYPFGCSCTFPDIPVSTSGTGATATQITANWNAATGATSYSLDVSTVSDFSSFVAGYNDLNVGAVTTYDVTGLTCNTTYYYRIRAVNSCGETGNSNTINYATYSCPPFCGTQVWALVNLNVGTRVNGANEQSNNGMIEKYCYNDIEANCTTYGGLYQWAEAMQIPYFYNSGNWPTDYTCDPCGGSGIQGLCPAGYHIPTDLEWSRYEYCIENTMSPTGSTALAVFQTTIGLRGSVSAGVGPGDKMKVTAGDTPAWDGTNTGNFTALPAGFRDDAVTRFKLLDSYAHFWTATETSVSEANSRRLHPASAQVFRATPNKIFGYSVRCLQN